MEAQIYLYIWDNRWLWGLRSLPRTSWLWIMLIGINIYKIVIYIEKLRNEEGKNNSAIQARSIPDGAVLCDIFSLICCISLFIRQRWSIESKKVIQFLDLQDEDKWLIGHYLKRREALYTWQATMLYVIGLSRAARIAYLYLWANQGAAHFSFLDWLDLACAFNIAFTAFIWLFVKIVCVISYNFPFAAGRIKGSFVRSPPLSISQKRKLLTMNKEKK